jgi:hypothetical protein
MTQGVVERKTTIPIGAVGRCSVFVWEQRNLEDLNQELGVNFDGLLGEDLLREFHSVRINYKAHVIELEQ